MEQIIPVGIAIVTIIGGLAKILYNNLNAKTTIIAADIKDTREKYVTKEEYNRTTDRLNMKLDKIIDLIVEGRHER
ncbi:MAG: hypothetical protein GY787_27490 [Alteromonadales bacterium]|nr:hypothetical protein [Alteromonadales bacterium]